MTLRQNPRFERKPRRIQGERHHIRIFRNQPAAVGGLLLQDVAEDTPFLRLEMQPRAVHLVAHFARHNRQRDELRVRVLQRGTRRGTVVLENDLRPESPVALGDPGRAPPRRQHLLDRALVHRRQRVLVARRLDDHFVGADAVHLVEEPLATPVEASSTRSTGN